MRYKGKLVHTIDTSDVGKSVLFFDKKKCKCCGHVAGGGVLSSSILGRVLLRDVGKQILEVKNRIYQVESDQQMKDRISEG